MNTITNVMWFMFGVAGGMGLARMTGFSPIGTDILSLPGFLVALSSMIYTSIQAYFSKMQTEQNREHNKLSVRPYISIMSQTNDNDLPYYYYEIVNAGVGPAIITNIKYFFDEKDSESIGALLKEPVREQKLVDDAIFTNINCPAILSAGERIVLLKLSTKNKTEAEKYIERQIIDSIGVKIRYESIYKEEFNCPPPKKT